MGRNGASPGRDRFGQEIDLQHRIAAAHYLFRGVQHLADSDFFAQQLLFDAGQKVMQDILAEEGISSR